MAKLRTLHRCTQCGGTAPQWLGRCPDCAAWGTLVEEFESTASQAGSTFGLGGPDKPIPIDEVQPSSAPRLATGIAELDRVLDGGLVSGSVTLLGGEPGIGKSTLLLQALGKIAANGTRCLLVTAEESKHQVRMRAERLGVMESNLLIAAETSIGHVISYAGEFSPGVLAVDSIQAVFDPDIGAAPGSVTQVREATQRLVRLAKESDLPVILIGHVTKDGGLAGPRLLEHVVDTVLSFEGDRHHAFRMLRALKHRFGSTSELGLFEMQESGLADVVDPSSLFLADRRSGASGSVVVPILEGARPLLVEVQALCSENSNAPPRRSAQGADSGRLELLLAVLKTHAACSFAACDVFVSVAGGVKVAEPGADLAIALAVASAKIGRPVPDAAVVVGEVGLGGEVRQAAQTSRRLAEAARLGFTHAIAPMSAPDVAGIQIFRVPNVHDALRVAQLVD